MYNKTDHWQQHVGSIWASLLSGHLLNCSGTIIEIGPGFTDKIGRGLAKLNFQGKLYVIEPNTTALECIASHYQILLPNAMIIPVNKTAKDACSILPDAVEAILMNHVLDDMVLHAALPPVEKRSIFSQIRPDESCLSQIKHAWQGLLNDPQYLSELKHGVLTDLCNLVDYANARIVGINQYKSWFLFQNELEEADQVGNELFCEIVLQFGDMSIEDKDILQSYGQNPQEWLIIERESTLEISDTKPNLIQQATRN